MVFFGIFDKITNYIKDGIIDGIGKILSGIFDSINEDLIGISNNISVAPDTWNTSIWEFVKNISTLVILPVAALIIAAILVMEYVQLAESKNNLKEIDVIDVLKPLFKFIIALMFVKNCTKIFLFAFKIGEKIITDAKPYLNEAAKFDDSYLSTIKEALKENSVGSLMVTYIELLIVRLAVYIISIAIHVIIYGRIIEIYLMGAIAPIPVASITSQNHNWNFGNNYLKNLGALALQGFLIMLCVTIFAILIKSIDYTNAMKAVWSVLGYAVLLMVTMLKTGSLAKSIFNAH